MLMQQTTLHQLFTSESEMWKNANKIQGEIEKSKVKKKV